MATTADQPVPKKRGWQYRCEFLVWDDDLRRVRRCRRPGRHRMRGQHYCGEHRNRRLAMAGTG